MTSGAAPVRPKETLFRVLLVLGSCAFGFGVLAILAKLEVFDYRGLLGVQKGQEILVADGELLHRHAPYTHLVGSHRGGGFTMPYQIPPAEMYEYHWDAKYDRNGFRNDSDLSQAGIAVIGDSFVEAMTVPDAQIMTTLLAGTEKQTVANLGHLGYGPLEELVVLKRYALPLRPHTVIWMFYEGNDLRDVIAYHRAIRELAATSTDRGRDISPVHQIFSHLHNEVSDAIRRATRPPGIQREGMVRTPDGTQVPEYFEDPPHAFTAAYLGALNETVNVIREAEQLCASVGTRFVFVFIPSKFRAFQPYCSFPARSECRTWVLNDLPKRLEEAVGPTSAETGWLDLTNDLSRAVSIGEFPYYSDDGHWSPAGNRIAAAAIHRYLRKHPGA